MGRLKNKVKKIRARAVLTPGSSKKSPGRGRPKKLVEVRARRGPYKTGYTEEEKKRAIEEVKEGRMSERRAAREYGIPRSTLKDMIGERVTHDTAGRPPVLSKEEEELIVERLIIHGEWGFPLSSTDLRHVIKDYLDSQGRTSRFVNNMPGPDFVTSFMQRHPILSKRKANLIKRGRAAVTHEIVQDFFKRFAVSAQGVPPENMHNYDETYLQDNPGCITAIYKKGTKHAEHVRNHSKTSISVMICGSATGKLLHPYVVYKGQNVYRAWCEGYKEARFSATESGWFGTFTFTDFFIKCYLPEAKKLPGKKLLLGDNLSSHISLQVIDLCRENNIEFVCLPANSTHLMQPLDVGLFGPMKSEWRSQLRAYKDRYPTGNPMDKVHFPAMLKQLIQNLKPLKHLPKECTYHVN